MTTQEILQQCIIDGNVVKLPTIQLERKSYIDVAKQLNLIGGKWKGGKIQGFVFEQDPTELLKQISNGEQRNLKKEFQFFETPDELADRLVSLAKINSNKVILEPSAGRGAIVKAILRKHPSASVHGYELMDINLTFLNKIDKFYLLGKDFLTAHTQSYQYIVANPPFSKNQDIDHIRNMYQFLNDGGRLVSIASNHWRDAVNRKETEFRDWLKDVNAEIHEIECGTFKSSGTLVGACIIVINKN